MLIFWAFVTLGLLVGLSLLWWISGRTPADRLIEEIAKAAPVTDRQRPRDRKKCRMTVPGNAADTVIGKQFACPKCGITRGRRGPFVSKASLASHVGRCRSAKIDRKKGR